MKEISILKDLTDQYLQNINQLFDLKQKNIDEIKQIYENLIEILNYHSRLYYIENSPNISDYQYDRLFDLLKKIEIFYPLLISKDSPNQQINDSIKWWFKTIEHKVPLLSLENTYSSEDLEKRNDQIKKILSKNEVEEYSFIVQPKFDWISIELVYINNILENAITRWDGYIWEDLIQNVKTIENIPKKLNTNLNIKELRIRWEILIKKSTLKEINLEKQKNWEQIFANTRNATAGTLRQHNSNIVKKRKLICYVYELLYTDNEILNNFNSFQNEIKPFLKDIWFENQFSFENFEEKFDEIKWVIDFCNNEKFLSIKDSFDIDFDWLVIKIDEIKNRVILWNTNHHPRWASAFKFKAKQVVTKLIDVKWQISRLWNLNPSARLKPVELWWVVIQNATLHNLDFIYEKDIQINDDLWIQRSWEVIPYILWPIKENRNWSEKKIVPPQLCPSCWHQIVKKNDEEQYFCENQNCIWKIREKIIFFVSKDWMNLKWFWEKIINLLIDSKIILNIQDFYKLSIPQNLIKLNSLVWMWKKRVSILLEQIEKSKNSPLSKIILSLWIKYIWKKSSQIIVDSIYNDLNLKKIEKIDLELILIYLKDKVFLENIYWIWEKTIESIVDFFSKTQNYDILKSLESYWMKFDNLNWNKSKPENLIHFSISWKFDIEREKIVKLLEINWFIFDDKIKNSTNFLIAWKDCWTKLWIAQKNKIKIYEWLNQFCIDFKYIEKQLDDLIIQSKNNQNKKNNFQDSLF